MQKLLRPAALSGVIMAAFAHSSANANGAPSTDLTVTGVIKPVSCDLTMPDKREVNYGTIARKDLFETAYKVLPQKRLGFIVTCASNGAKLALSVVDAKSESKVTNLASLVKANANETSMYGLGQVGTKKVGAYRIGLENFKGDNLQVEQLISPTNSGGNYTWEGASTDGLRTDAVTSWASAGSTVPGNFTNIKGELVITAVINKLPDLPEGDEVPLAGAATLQLHYL